MVRWELVFDPMPPDEPDPVPYERSVGLDHYLGKRRQAGGGGGGDLAPETAATRDPASNVAAAAKTTAVCDCTLNHEPAVLSDDHYPSVLPAVTCHDAGWCKKTVYPVRVLVKKTAAADEDAPPGKTAVAYIREGLPNVLVRQNWRFVQIDVTVACTCFN